MSSPSEAAVVAVPAVATHELRRTMLRTGTLTTDVTFDGDDEDTTVHLAVVEHRPAGPVVVAISTWLERPCPVAPERPGVQLRGMATAPEHRGRGHGSRLLAAGLRRAGELGSHLVWANARDTALGFYLARGFEVIGDGHVDPATGLAHHLVVRRLP